MDCFLLKRSKRVFSFSLMSLDHEDNDEWISCAFLSLSVDRLHILMDIILFLHDIGSKVRLLHANMYG